EVSESSLSIYPSCNTAEPRSWVQSIDQADFLRSRPSVATPGRSHRVHHDNVRNRSAFALIFGSENGAGSLAMRLERRLVTPMYGVSRVIRGRKYLRHQRNPRFWKCSKNFKKVKKKACQPLAPSIKRGFDATNVPQKPFKKTLKKVKKKLVSTVKI